MGETLDIWIQLENRAWDVCPSSPIDRLTGQSVTAGPVEKTLTSPATKEIHTIAMNAPLDVEALILRRYTADWKHPEDRKVNPWDLNEPYPGEGGTLGTIPGPVIECDVGTTLRVHFRNLDLRDETARKRTHSLHPHGIVFAPEHDGAYPLSPPDAKQPIPSEEEELWRGIGVKGVFKQSDRVPPRGTFTYTWDARWPTTAGVWLYHDHSICDMENVALGAIGFLVIRNPDDEENEVEITKDRLPGGSWVSFGPVKLACFGGPGPVEGGTGVGDAIGVLPHDLARLGDLGAAARSSRHGSGSGDPTHGEGMRPMSRERALRHHEMLIELDQGLELVSRICFPVYRQPPDQALFLLLFHDMPGAGACINGRKYLGNTPTLVAGPKTRMRFGVAGSDNALHTFHIHGHRWVTPGPAGTTTEAIGNSPQVQAVSQFEDTKIFGPANTFAFTIDEGKGFMRADPPVGEWHLHCHVFMHMMMGMMGSLLIVEGGEWALPLPVGVACPEHMEEEPHTGPDTGHAVPTTEVDIANNAFHPPKIMVESGATVTWTNHDPVPHTVTGKDGKWDSSELLQGETFSRAFSAGFYTYYCKLHPSMGGSIEVVDPVKPPPPPPEA